MDYCEDLTRSCENLNSGFPAQTVLLIDKHLNLLSSCLIFLSSMSVKTNGRENSNVHNFLTELHNNLSMFLKSLGLYFRQFLLLSSTQ